jgi:cation transport regulator ChaC
MFRKKMKYFAYGSNMDPLQMKEANVPFSERWRAVLTGHVLRFNKVATRHDAQEGEGKGNIVEKENEIVEGVLYKIYSSDLRGLDEKEGYPKHYNRIFVKVKLDDHHTKVRAVTYVAQPSMTRDGLKPTREYLSHYLAAREILSESYYQKLLAVETLD